MTEIIPVSELTRRLRDVVESEFPFLWVRGEVTNLARPSSGHVYFTLTDGESVLPVVWFRSNRQTSNRDGDRVHPLTGEVLEPSAEGDRADLLEEGVEALCAGPVSIYSQRGSYQMRAEVVEVQARGSLAQAFEALKRELAARGWFDTVRKKPLPPRPKRVALVTSATGAAVRDFLRVADTRGSGAGIRIFPTRVQGEGAPAEIARALAEAAGDGWPQVVALIRGGGSLEDLACFNSEVTARAIVDCPVPVVSGVGHEIDTTIADLCADVRAATPSVAAEILWPPRHHLVQEIDGLEERLARSLEGLLRTKAAELSAMRSHLHHLSPLARLQGLLARHQDRTRDLVLAKERFLARRKNRLKLILDRLERSFGPNKVEARSLELSRTVRDLRTGARLLARDKKQELEGLASRLAALDPEAPLTRGYALVRLEKTGRFLRSVTEAAPGDRIGVRVADGEIPATVTREED